ncbi:MAG: hypothetical protein EOO90_01910 [Pedobacter sp.]|nr:MAG: hypothetical protein EOO90_01910 [Pedobacter sp.]
MAEQETEEEKYLKDFQGDSITSNTKQAMALERVWKNRDFDIEHYWKRAAYFWTFIAAAFAGYFLLLTKDAIDEIVGLVVICLGLIFSLAWMLVNIGSKMWQENWEAHIDLLEDAVTGPVYKYVHNDSKYRFSVSKINQYVSYSVFAIWLFLFFWHLYQKFEWGTHLSINWFVVILVAGTLFFMLMMFFKGRTVNPSQRKKYNMVKR